MLLIYNSATERADHQGAYFDGSLELLRELAVTNDVDAALPRLSEIVSKMLPHDALRMACFNRRGRVIVNVSTAVVPDMTRSEVDEVIIDDLRACACQAAGRAENELVRADDGRKDPVDMYVTACVAFVPGCIRSGRKRLEREPGHPAQHRTWLTAPRARPPQTLRRGTQPRMSTLTGARISRYEILDLLGSGGMGEVYRARDHDLHRDVAIKFLPQRFISDPTRLARFEQEARTASALNHPNIVTIHEIGVVPGIPPYIVMEYVQGRTLRAVLHETRLAPRLVLDIASQLADGIAKAHTAGIVHRDLKPENVMVTADGFVKILDFGLAKLRSDLGAGTAVGVGSETQETVSSPDTAIGVLVGTAAYMSPEQARGEEADFHADQFALGVMLYEMATGRRPFRGESVVQTLTAVIEDEPEPIALTRPEFSEAVRQIVGRCLAKAPRDRYASTVDLARDLRQARERMSESGAAFEAAPVVPEHARARVGCRRALVAALGSVVAAATLLYSASGKIGRWWLPLPPEMRLVVLPITADHGPQLAQGCAGLQEYVTARLGDLQRFRSRLAVVPAAEMLDGGVRSPSAARRVLGANLALSITVHDTGSDRLVTVSLADTSSVRQLRGDARTFAAGTFSPEAVVELATLLLDLELGPDEQRRWSGAASPSRYRRRRASASPACAAAYRGAQ